MSDFPRLANDEKAPGAALLRAAREDAPPPEVLERTLLAVGAGIAASTIASAAAAKTAKAGMGLLTKYALVGFASGVIAAGGGAVAHHLTSEVRRAPESGEAPPRRAVPGAPSQRAASATPAVEVAVESSPAPAADTPVKARHATQAPSARSAPPNGEPANAAPPALVSAAPAPGDSAMEAEVRLLDEARQHVGAGRGREALEAIARYSREVKNPRLAPEAQYLQMEAHHVRGDRAAASRSAQALLERYPRGPHALRARKILQGP